MKGFQLLPGIYASWYIFRFLKVNANQITVLFNTGQRRASSEFSFIQTNINFVYSQTNLEICLETYFSTYISIWEI